MPSRAPDDLEQRVVRLEERLAEIERLLGGAPPAADAAQELVADVARSVLGLRGGFEELRDASMKTLPQWDSLAQVEFLVALEQRSGLRFAAAELPELTSIEAAYELVRSKL